MKVETYGRVFLIRSLLVPSERFWQKFCPKRL
jgi:hypothetical protein